MTLSVSRKGDCWDNAPKESANGTVKIECVLGEHFRTRAEAQQALVEYIGYYNTQPRHSSLGNLSPAAFEQRWHDALSPTGAGGTLQ
ncbi:MAG: integrase core domain-containing protein [Accumulibacter sp.]|jgi:putative transposase|uniref:integrase core domain-containing protein n=1 Tax=Accumulibacter sp. TaxID=2053492 RepID=UPI002FC3DD56